MRRAFYALPGLAIISLAVILDARQDATGGNPQAPTATTPPTTPTVAPPATPVVLDPPGKFSVILISMDGLRPDAITAHGPDDVPAFYRLRREGAFTDNARSSVNHTVTLPNHTGMITGRLVDGLDGHGWTWNKDPLLGDNLHRNKGAYLESIFSVAHDCGRRTAFCASKSKFSLFDLSYDEKNGMPDVTGEDNGRDKIDVFIQQSNSESAIDDLEKTMKEDCFDFLMVHIRNADTAGHGFSWTTSRPSIYMAAVKKADELLADILEQVEKNPDWKGRTYIVLTADHGGLTGARVHDAFEERENFTVPFYVWGPGIPAGADLYALNTLSRKDPGVLNPPADPSIPGAPAFSLAPTVPGAPVPPVVASVPGIPVPAVPPVRPAVAGTGAVIPPAEVKDLPPIRNADVGNLCLSLLGLPPIPGSTVNAKQDLKVRAEDPVPEVTTGIPVPKPL